MDDPEFRRKAEAYLAVSDSIKNAEDMEGPVVAILDFAMQLDMSTDQLNSLILISFDNTCDKNQRIEDIMFSMSTAELLELAMIMFKVSV